MNPIATILSGSSLTRTALEISPAAVVIANESGNILFANARAESWFGYLNPEIQGLPLSGLLPGFGPAAETRDQRSQVVPWLSQPQMSHCCLPTAPCGTQIVRCKDGSEVNARVTLHCVEEQSTPLILVHFDKAEPAPIDGKLLETERLNAIATMIRGLSHESRNALQRAVACLDLMDLDLREDDEQRELSGKIRRSLTDLLENYDEVRRFAQPISLSRSRCSIGSLCAEAFEEAVKQNYSAPVSLNVIEPDSVEDELEVDGPRLKEAFREIMANAFEGDPQGDTREVDPHEVHVTVRCFEAQWPAWGTWQESLSAPSSNQNQEASGKSICVAFHNDGVPFTTESLRCAFDPFYTSKQHGTGLGLSISRRIIHAHGGEISIGNPEEGGAEVRVILPHSEACGH